jgi:hypothetical protein
MDSKASVPSQAIGATFTGSDLLVFPVTRIVAAYGGNGAIFSIHVGERRAPCHYYYIIERGTKQLIEPIHVSKKNIDPAMKHQRS